VSDVMMTSSDVSDRACAFLTTARSARDARTTPVAPHIVLAVAHADDPSALIAADDALVARALESTARGAAGVRMREDGGVARIDAPFASALPLARGWLASALPGAPSALVCAPSRDTLLFAVDSGDDVVRRLADRAERAFHAARDPVSPAIYEAHAESLTPFHGAGTLANPTALGHALLAMTEYETQRMELDAGARADLLVAECQLMFHRDGDRPMTVATWGERVTTLLPIVDVVVVAGGDPISGWRFAIRWSDLAAKVQGSCFARDDSFVPARVRTIAWPDAASLRDLYAARDALLSRTASAPP
jgi:hypothetical protein